MLGVDTDLTAALRLTKKMPMMFAMIANGADSKLLVQKRKISAKQIAASKSECGGGKIYRGRCQNEEGTLVFEVAKEPPSTLALLLRKIIKSNAGLVLPVEVRVAADLADEEEDAEHQNLGLEELEARAPSAGPQAAAVTKRLNALKDGIKAALAGPDRAQVQTLVGTIQGLLKNRDFVQAERVLAELEPFIARAEAAATAPPRAAHDSNIVIKRLNTLAPAIKASLAGADRAAALKLVASVHDLCKKKNYTEASEVLDSLESLLARSTPAPSPTSAGPEGATIVKRLNGLGHAIKTALQGPQVAHVQSLIGAVNGRIKNNDFVQASRMLDELETLIARKPDPANPGKSTVAPEILYRQARLEYDRARKDARAGVEAVQTAILQAGRDDPQLPILREGVARLDEALAGLDDALFDTLDSCLNARDPASRERFQQQAIQQINSYLRFIKTDELLNFVDTNAFLKGKVRGPLFQALKSLKARLKA